MGAPNATPYVFQKNVFKNAFKVVLVSLSMKDLKTFESKSICKKKDGRKENDFVKTTDERENVDR